MKKRKGSLSILRTSMGFTLLEIILVIVIIGILAGVAVMHFFNLQDAAHAAACKANLQSLVTAQRMYYFKQAVAENNGEFASSLDDLVPYMRDGAIPECPSGGAYSLTPDGIAECTIASHNLGN